MRPESAKQTPPPSLTVSRKKVRRSHAERSAETRQKILTAATQCIAKLSFSVLGVEPAKEHFEVLECTLLTCWPVRMDPSLAARGAAGAVKKSVRGD